MRKVLELNPINDIAFSRDKICSIVTVLRFKEMFLNKKNYFSSDTNVLKAFKSMSGGIFLLNYNIFKGI